MAQGKQDSEQLIRQNRHLKSKLNDVIRMNTSWQRYDEQRETYILDLQKAHRDLLMKLAPRPKSQDSNLACAQDDDERINANTAPLCAMDAKFARKEQEIMMLKDENKHFKEHIAALQRNNENRRKEETERIAIFKAQLDICTEDFRQERRDLHKMQRAHSQLKRQLDEANRTIANLNHRVEQLSVENQWLPDRPARGVQRYAKYTPTQPRPDDYQYYRTDRKTERVYAQQRQPGLGIDIHDYHRPTDFPSDVEVDCERSDEVTSPTGSSDAIISEEVQGNLSASAYNRDDEVFELSAANVKLNEDDSDGKTSPTTSSYLKNRCSSSSSSSSSSSPSATSEDYMDRVAMPPVRETWWVGSGTRKLCVPGDFLPKEPIRCPRCKADFPLDDHSDLLEHTEQCTGSNQSM